MLFMDGRAARAKHTNERNLYPVTTPLDRSDNL